MDDSEEFEEEEEAAADEWEEFRKDDGQPIRIEKLKRLDLENMPEDVRISVMDDYFPETAIWREGEILICEIQEHLYTKYWEHKFSAYAFAEAMQRAVVRLQLRRLDDDAVDQVRLAAALPARGGPVLGRQAALVERREGQVR